MVLTAHYTCVDKTEKHAVTHLAICDARKRLAYNTNIIYIFFWRIKRIGFIILRASGDMCFGGHIRASVRPLRATGLVASGSSKKKNIKELKKVTVLCGHRLLVVVLSIADCVTQQETSEVFLWDERPLKHSRIQGHIGEGDVLRTTNWSFEKWT